jgi:hypothetical protein
MESVQQLVHGLNATSIRNAQDEQDDIEGLSHGYQNGREERLREIKGGGACE